MQQLIEIFPSVYKLIINDQTLLVTRNLTPGTTYYGEPTFQIDDKEYRSWNPTRSKLAAGILKNIKTLPIKESTRVLYLGIASGTTASHVSDIVGPKGHVYGLDFAPRSMRDLLDKVIVHRKNISPILGDARKPQSYSILVPKVDVIFADVAQPDQADIVVKNARYFLKKGGWVMFSIKSRSIDVRKKPQEIYEEQIKILEAGGLAVSELVELDPFEKDHAMAIAEFA